MKPASVGDLVNEQIEGAAFAASRPVSMIADVMGIGKTAQAVHCADITGARRVTVLCPPALCKNWAREFAMWSYVGYATDIASDGRHTFRDGDGVAICSYPLTLNASIHSQIAARGGDLLILDEAHRLKNPAAKTTCAVLGKSSLARHFDRVLFLSGTPAPNDPSEFYPFLKTAGAWTGNLTAFQSVFCDVVETEYGTKIVGARNVPLLKKLLEPLMLRRGEVRGLPPLHTDVIAVSGSAGAIADLEAAIPPGVAASLTAAAEAGDWQFFDQSHVATIRRLTGIAKAPQAADVILAELRAHGYALAFAVHSPVIDTLSARLAAAGVPHGILDGRTSKIQRQRHVDEFQAGTLRALICQIQAAGEGLTLTRASRVLMVESAWTPAANDQCIARAWRRGQQSPVHASFLALGQSFDAAIASALARKSATLAQIL